jgi:deoxyribonuclease IV
MPPAPARSPVGAHCMVRGGLARGALRHAEQVGAEAVQVFVSNPRGWARSAGDPAQDEAFRDHCARRGIPVFVHAPYLVNVGSPSPQTLARSVEAVRHSLVRGAQVGAAGVVVHAGSAVGARYDAALRQVREHLRPLLDEIPDGGPALLVEPTAGGGDALVARVGQLPAYLDALDHHPRVGVCLDTCHLYAAGHDVGDAAGMRAALDAFVAEVGAGRLRLVHANDTADPLGSARDRHASIGTGRIGLDAFAALFAHRAVRGVPVVVETPEEGHVEDLTLLREARGQRRARAAAAVR